MIFEAPDLILLILSFLTFSTIFGSFSRIFFPNNFIKRVIRKETTPLSDNWVRFLGIFSLVTWGTFILWVLGYLVI